MTDGVFRDFKDIKDFLNRWAFSSLLVLMLAPSSLALPAEDAGEIPGLPPQEQSEAQPEAQKEESRPLSWSNEINPVIQNEIARYTSALSRIVGQDEVKKGLIALRTRELYFGTEITPPLIALLGLPGTGKDTTVETDIDALNDRVGAYKNHLYRVPVIRTVADLSKLTGSPAGYVDSENLPEIIQFIVAHSGGRYEIIEQRGLRVGETVKYVVENHLWSPGKVFPGYFAPEKAGIFINEFHDWTRLGLNEIKEFLEKGVLKIANPKDGLGSVQWTGRTYLASNDGCQLYSSLEPEGKRFGSPLSYEEMLNLWRPAQQNRKLLMDTLRETRDLNGEPRFSPEVLNRLKPSTSFLLAPLSPSDLQKIVQLKIGLFLDRFKSAPRETKGLGALLQNLEITVHPHLYQFIQEYEYEAEGMGRPLVDKLSTLFENTLAEAFSQGKIAPGQTATKIELDIRDNSDRTASLVIRNLTDTTSEEILVPIASTLSRLPEQPLSDAEIELFNEKREQLGRHVFGAKEALDRVAMAMLRTQALQRSDAKEASSATILVFAGLTSTGKSEAVKAVGRVYYNDENAVYTTDFSNVRTEDQLEKALMNIGKALDRGKKVIFLDEVINADPRFLLRLYPLLRESYADLPGGRRNMKGVLVVMAGNMGSEWFAGIPTGISTQEKIAAQKKIFEDGVNNEGLIQSTLRKAGFTDAMIARLSGSIIFFDPHGFKSIRQLTQAKLRAALSDLKPKSGVRGWNLQFASREDLVKTIETLETEAYLAEQQGASIDNYISKFGFKNRLYDLLLKNSIPDGANVLIHFKGKKSESRGARKYELSEFQLETPRGALPFTTHGRIAESYPANRATDEILTAFHEAGHSILTEALFGSERMKQTRISTVPGVDFLGREYMEYYLGVVSWEELERVPLQRSVVIAHMATLLGGEVAQTLVTRGARHDAGKANDTERAARLAQMAILRWGLSEKWGVSAIPQNQPLSDYVATLTDKRKELLDSETQQMFEEAKSLARGILLANYDGAFVPLAQAVIEARELGEAELQSFYQSHQVVKRSELGVLRTLKALSSTSLAGRFSKFFKAKDQMSAELLPTLRVPNGIEGLEQFIQKQKQAEVEQVELDPSIPVFQGKGSASALQHEKAPAKASAAASCEASFL